jgi:hypothetical protein
MRRKKSNSARAFYGCPERRVKIRGQWTEGRIKKQRVVSGNLFLVVITAMSRGGALLAFQSSRNKSSTRDVQDDA